MDLARDAATMTAVGEIMRKRKWLGVAAATSLAWLGCGDRTAVRPDGRPADAAVEPDTSCFKFAECPAPVAGGEVRVEHVRYPGGNGGARVTSFVYGDPGTRKLFEDPNVNGCNDLRGKDIWPVATNPLEERTYLDPGDVLIAGGPAVLEVPRQTALGTDPLGRVHPANAWFLHDLGATGSDGATYLAGNTRFDVIFTGSPQLPAQIFDDALYMPADFTLLAPDTEPYALTAGRAHTFTSSVPAVTAPTGYLVYSAVVFTGEDGPAVLCMEPDDGSIVVPAAMVDIVRAAYPQGGTLERQRFTVVVRPVRDASGPTDRRIDLVGITSYVSAFTAD